MHDPGFRLNGQHVTLMGLGRHGGGVTAARWLAQQGARLTITDLAPAEQLADSLAAIADLPLQSLRLGEHCEADFTAPDWIVVNPAVKPEHPLLKLAVENGARITTETELFLRGCSATVIGVTGSNGKSTTAAMTAAIVQASDRRVWLGGNIGRSLLTDLPSIQPADVVVLELSSFQLYYLPPDLRGPRIAVITNCAANHLDWHGSFEHYAASKQRLLSLQRADDIAVLNVDDSQVSRWKSFVQGRIVAPFSEARVPPLRVTGAHNRTNAALAAAAAREAGCSDDAIAAGLAAFTGLPHRMELVATAAGRRFYNDSKATTPEATIAALNACTEPVWLLIGGFAKGGDYEALAHAVAKRVRGVACFGQSRPMLIEHLERCAGPAALYACATLAEGFSWCWKHSRAGDAILLSPACASLDQFRDYAHRGETFRELCLGLTV